MRRDATVVLVLFASLALPMAAMCQTKPARKPAAPAVKPETSRVPRTCAVEITKRDGHKVPAKNALDESSFFAVTRDSWNVELEVPISIISRIAFSADDRTVRVFLGDETVVEGRWEGRVYIAMDPELGESGIPSKDIQDLTFKHQASTSYSAQPHGTHRAVVHLAGGKQLGLTGASFRASKFDQNHHDIGAEYPDSVRFDSEVGGGYNMLTWDKIKTIAPLSQTSGVVDCKLTTPSGRELTGWANYWWTANRIEGIVPVGRYTLPLVVSFSAGPTHDYVKVELE